MLTKIPLFIYVGIGKYNRGNISVVNFEFSQTKIREGFEEILTEKMELEIDLKDVDLDLALADLLRTRHAALEAKTMADKESVEKQLAELGQRLNAMADVA